MKQVLSRFPGLLLVTAIGLVVCSSAFGQATIVIDNGDVAGVGFNDPTPAAPVGGNGGTTLGEQRLIAFQAAANIWGATITSGPVIHIHASWAALPCTPNSGTLGTAGATSIYGNFANAPFTNTWYGVAEANALAGRDLNGGDAEIEAQFNFNLGTPDCLSSRHWYYGLDNNHGSGIDLVTVLLHEFAHGLGFQSFTDETNGTEPQGFPSVFDRFLLDNTTGKTWPQMTDTERQASAINRANLVWNGAQTTSDAFSTLAAGRDSVGHPLMYAPQTVEAGSSVSHWDIVENPNQLMEPIISSDLTHNITAPSDLTFSLLKDIGWCAGCPPPPPPTPTPTPIPTPTPPTTIEFYASNFSVNEASDFAHIIISRRGGDLSGVSTVQYRTVDSDSLSVGCGTKQGAAYARCDFAGVAGTLTFGPGSLTESFVVPIVNDSYAEGNETFSVVLSNPTGATLGSPSTATVTINDNESQDAPNPIMLTNVQGIDFFIRQHYLDFLGRLPEPLQPWNNLLAGCADQFNFDPGGPSASCDRITVSGAFFGSPEFKTKGFYVIDMYRVAFNRLPTYVEFSTDLASVTGATSQEALTKRAAYATNFVQRTDFADIYAPNVMSNAEFVNSLMGGYLFSQGYNLISITTIDPTNPDNGTKVVLTRTNLIDRLNGNLVTRAQVLRAIVQSDEISLQLEAINAFVASQYYGYLRRAPDQSGFNNWVNYMKANPNDFRTMINGFLNSNEYRLRFGPTP